MLIKSPNIFYFHFGIDVEFFIRMCGDDTWNKGPRCTQRQPQAVASKLMGWFWILTCREAWLWKKYWHVWVPMPMLAIFFFSGWVCGTFLRNFSLVSFFFRCYIVWLFLDVPCVLISLFSPFYLAFKGYDGYLVVVLL